MPAFLTCKRFFFAFLFFAFYFNTIGFAQDKEAREVINTLTSKKYFGRGYIKDGDEKAANFLRKKFEAFGLKPINGNYFQDFTMPVNTFPGAMELKVDGKELQPGKDFIVYPASAAAQKTYPVFLCDTTNVIQKLEENTDICLLIPVSVFDKKRNDAALLLKEKKTTGAVIFLEEKKLTWSVTALQYKIPVFTVLTSAFPTGTKNVSVNVDVVFHPEHKTQNVIGMVEGSSKKDSFLLFTAHYDHLGGMGKKTFFPGANDNASGTSMLLVLAEYFSKPENKPAYNMVFISFAGEEAGLKGSEYYVQHPLFPLEKIRFLTNLDLLGTGDDGIMVVNATEFKEDFQRLKSINDSKNYVTKINERGKAKNSDHYYFSENGVPAFFIYTMGGVSWYHDVFDKAATLPLTDFNDVFSLLRDFAISF